MIDKSLKIKINEYLDGELDVDKLSEVKVLIKSDNKIKRYYEDMKAVKEKVGELKDEKRFMIFQKLWPRRIKKDYDIRLIRRRTFRSLGVVAACFVIVIFGVRVLGPSGRLLNEAPMAKESLMEAQRDEAATDMIEEESAVLMEAPEAAIAAEESVLDKEDQAMEAKTTAYNFKVPFENYDDFIERLNELNDVGENDLEIFESSATLFVNRHNKDDVLTLLDDYDLIENEIDLDGSYIVIIFE